MFNDSLFNESLFNANGSQNPTSGSVYAALLIQAVNGAGFDENQVALSLTKRPPISKASQFYLTITPGEEYALAPQVSGAGRYLSGMQATFAVNIYCQLALDVAYQDLYYVEQALRPKVYDVMDAYQIFIPMDSVGTPLVQDPVRCFGNVQTVKYGKSPEWGMTSIVFGYKYTRYCNQVLAY